MHNRLRLLRLITAMLYFGPLLAGLMGQGWAMVPVFVGIFLLWSVILRPHLWPKAVGDLGQSEAAVALLSLVATQVLLVIVLFALGRGIGGVVGMKPALPTYLPIALSFLSVPLSRLVWNPRVMAQNVGFDPLLHKVVEGPAEAADPGEEAAVEMLAHLVAADGTLTEDALQQRLTAIAEHLDPVVIRDILGDAVKTRKAGAAGVKALIIHATDWAVSDLLSETGYPAQAFVAAGKDPQLLALFARRCMMLLEDDPDLASDCPDSAVLLRAAGQTRDLEARTALNRLAGLLDQISARPEP